MKAVILESYVMEEGDLDWSGVKALVPDTTSYVRTDYADIAPRIGDAELVLINKCRIDEAVLAQCPNLKWVGIIATGTDNIDLEACRRHGVAVANVPGYSTYSVAQMTFSLLLAICQCAQRYDRAVKDGYWQLGIPAEYGLLPQVELLGKTFGIYGYGSIGRQTARIAKAFGMEVLVCTRTVRPEYAADGVEFVDFDTLLARSDVLSLHCPATPETRGLVSREALAKMKPGAILLNTARGALVDEEAVADALESGNGSTLEKWAKELMEKEIHVVNMLGCHDGIPLLDLKGLIPEERIQQIIDTVVARGGYVKDLHGQKNVYYQVNATYYSALGEDDKKMLMARALQMFMPGKPQVWYLDLFAGKNDHEAVKRAGAGGHKEINRTNLSAAQIEELMKTDIVKEQLKLLHFRNVSKAFGFDAELAVSTEGEIITFIWTNQGESATLRANLKTFEYEITDSEGIYA